MRPKIHFAPEKGWMNDPNGLVFYSPFKGILSFPRKLTLHKTLEGYRLHHKFYTLTDIFESDICESNLCEGVTYTKNQDFETLIDGCVKEMIFNNGYSCMTSYID